MLILLAVIAGVVAGLAIHFTLPNRPARGVVLAPAIGAATAALLYTGMQWAGIAESNPWLWVVSVGVPVIVTYLAVGILSRSRVVHDDAERVRLRIA